MPSFHITIRDAAPEPCEGDESHTGMENARQSGVRTAVRMMLESKTLEGPQQAMVTICEQATTVTHIVRVSLLVSHTVRQGDSEAC